MIEAPPTAPAVHVSVSGGFMRFCSVSVCNNLVQLELCISWTWSHYVKASDWIIFLIILGSCFLMRNVNFIFFSHFSSSGSLHLSASFAPSSLSWLVLGCKSSQVVPVHEFFLLKSCQLLCSSRRGRSELRETVREICLCRSSWFMKVSLERGSLFGPKRESSSHKHERGGES